MKRQLQAEGKKLSWYLPKDIARLGEALLTSPRHTTVTPSVRITTAISNRRSTGFRDGRSDTRWSPGSSKDSHFTLPRRRELETPALRHVERHRAELTWFQCALACGSPNNFVPAPTGAFLFLAAPMGGTPPGPARQSLGVGDGCKTLATIENG